MKTLRYLWIVVALSAVMFRPVKAQTEKPLSPVLDLKVYNADAGCFHVNSVLVSALRIRSAWMALRSMSTLIAKYRQKYHSILKVSIHGARAPV